MFDQNTIYGHTTVRIDKKGRVCLPAYTNAEKAEELVVMRYKSFYKIMTKAAIDLMMEDLDEKLEKAFLEDDKDFDALLDYRDYILTNIIREMTVTTQGRITLGDIYEGEESIRMIGAGDGVYILNEAEYQKLKKLHRPETA